jgi:hypothetical protein
MSTTPSDCAMTPLSVRSSAARLLMVVYASASRPSLNVRRLHELYVSGRKLDKAAPCRRQGRMASKGTLSTPRLHRHKEGSARREWVRTQSAETRFRTLCNRPSSPLQPVACMLWHGASFEARGAKVMSHFKALIASGVCAVALAAAPVAHSAILNI